MKPQILIDSEIIKQYVLGSDQDREVLGKLYGGVLSELLEKIFFEVLTETIHSFEKRGIIKQQHPVIYKGKQYNIEIIIHEDKE